MLRAVNGHDVFYQHVHRIRVLTSFGVDLECLFEKSVVNSNLGNLINVIARETLNVTRDLGLVCTDRREHQQILQAAVITECRWLQHNRLEQLNQLVGQVCSHERLDGCRHVFGVGRFRHGHGRHLINQGAAMHIVFFQDRRPQLWLTTQNKVAGLMLVHGVIVSDGDKLSITEALGVCNVGQVRVTLLTVFTDDKGVVQVVFLEKGLRVLVAVNADLGHSIVQCLILTTRLDLLLEPGHNKLEPVALLDLVGKLIYRDGARHRLEDVLDDTLVAIHI